MIWAFRPRIGLKISDAPAKWQEFSAELVIQFLSAFITPLEEIRKSLREIFEPGQFVEIYLDCPLEICESRDPKGLYRRARNGEIPEFTGISSPFEPPEAAEIVVPTGKQTPEESLNLILSFLGEHFPDLRSEPLKKKSPARNGKTKSRSNRPGRGPSVFGLWRSGAQSTQSASISGTWDLGAVALYRSPHNRARVGYYYDRKRPRRAGHLRFPESKKL